MTDEAKEALPIMWVPIRQSFSGPTWLFAMKNGRFASLFTASWNGEHWANRTALVDLTARELDTIKEVWAADVKGTK